MKMDEFEKLDKEIGKMIITAGLMILLYAALAGVVVALFYLDSI